MPTPAPWIANLPRDARGFPVPAEAGWRDGQPVLSAVAADRKVALGMRRACAVCGYEMPTGRPVFRAWAQGDAAHMRQYERERSHDLSGPLHRSCVFFSAMVCPYLREKNSRLAKSSTISPGARRGTRAAIMGFKDFGLLMYAEPHNFLDPAKPSPNFAYLEMVEDIGYRDGDELADRYQAAVESDVTIIDTSCPRLYWTDTKSDLKALANLLHADYRQIARSTPVYEQVILGQGRFVAFPL